MHIFSFVGSDTRLRDIRDKIAASPVADLDQGENPGNFLLSHVRGWTREPRLSELKGRWEQAGLPAEAAPWGVLVTTSKDVELQIIWS